jgi:hypothetical protein
MVEVQLHAEQVMGKPEIARVNCCYQAITLRTLCEFHMGLRPKRCRMLDPLHQGALHRAEELSDDVLAAIEGTF